MRILVTGGAGFIGRHLCRRLRDDGHEVWSLDCSTPIGGYPEDIHGISTMLGWGGASSYATWAHELPDEPDRIYHLACDASPKRYQEDPLFTINTCVAGTMECLELSMDMDRKTRILLASTSEIYGEPLEHPQKESLRTHINPTGPRSCYDLGKAMAECLMMDYHRQYGVDTRIARIFNTYGPGLDFDDGRVISNFVTQALKGEPLTIYGDGSQTRSFCYVDDMVEGLIRLMECEGPECHEPHNLGNPEEVDIKTIANRVVAISLPGDGCYDSTLYRSHSKHLPLPQDDPTRRCPDITRAKQNLGWEPRVGLSEGLKRTVEDFRSRMKPEAVR